MNELENENKKLESELKIFKIRAWKEKIVLLGVILIILAEAVFIVSLFKNSSFFSSGEDLKKPFIATININKEITVKYMHDIMQKCDELKDNKSLKGFLFIMNSPGGSPSASDEMNSYLKELSKEKNVSLYVESMAASGAYYISTAIKPIVANQNAVVGSIGVIMPHFVIKKLADKIGVESDNIAVGKYKEPISFFKKADKEQKEYLHNNLLDPTYQNFLSIVSKDRNISMNKLQKYADGKIFIANQVKGILVDKISTLVLYKKEIKKNMKIKKLEFIEISFEKKKFPLLNVKVEGNLLKEMSNYILK